MANNIIRRVWNQNRMVNIEDLTGMAFQAESGGHTFEISGIDDTGAAVTLSGTVSGVFRRPDNADIALTGAASDGVVSVSLSADCYAVPGRFALTIFVTSDGQTVAVYACVGTVAATSGGSVAGDTPQSVVDLIADIEAAVATIPPTYTDLMASIAPTYSSSALYGVGSYAWYNGSLYRCITAITTAETWTAAHWTAAVLGDDVSELKSAITPLISNTKTINTLDGLTIYGAVVDYDSTWWGNPTIPDKKHIVVEVPLIDGADVETVLTITANAEQSCRFAGLVSAPTEVVNGTSVGTFSAVWSAPILVDAGQTYSGSIPSDVKYLIINTMQSYKDCIASFNITSSKTGDVEDLQTSVAELENDVAELNTLQNEHITVDSLSGFNRIGGVVDYDSTWYGNANATDRKHVVIPLQDGINILSITAASNQDCRIAGLKSTPNAVVSNTSIGTLSDFWNASINISAGTTLNTLIPSDVKYLIINVLNSNNECVTVFNLDSTVNGKIGEADNKANQIIHFTVGAHNVRDFSDGSGDGCPDNLVSVNLPLWKKHVSEWQNQDFLCMDEWYPYFDRSQTIDSYSEIYKQFYPYMYSLPITNPNRVIMSKYPGIFTNMVLYAIPVNTNIPCIICNLGGKNVCVVCWLQSAADSVAVRTEAYRAAIAYLAQFDVVVVAGDFNTEVGLEELTVFTEAGYTLGNGGYWGVINTWPANNPATPNDNIVSKGTILKMFTVGNDPVSSDHLPIKAEFCFNT